MRQRLLPLVLIVLAACGGSGTDGSSPVTATGESSIVPTDSSVVADPVSREPVAVASDPVSTDAATAEAQTITSADGLVTLDIPAGAVPASAQITIEAAEPAEGSLVAYEFLPDGLEFAEPATVNVEIALEEAPLGEPVRPVRPAWLSSDGTEDDAIEFTFDGTDGGVLVKAEIDHFSRFEMIHGGFVTVNQIRPREFVEVGLTYDIFFEVYDSNQRLLVALIRHIAWENEFGKLTEGICLPAGPHRTPTILITVKDRNLFPDPDTLRFEGVILTSATTTCVDPSDVTDLSDVTELTSSPTGGGDEPYTGTVLFRVGDAGAPSFGFPLDQVPDGGTLGLGFEGADQMYFGQCIIERRAGEPSLCAIFDRTGFPMGSAEVVETIEDDTIWMGVPADFLDLTAGTMGDPPISIEVITVDRYDNTGASTHAFLDPGQLVEIAAGTPGS